MAPSKQGAVLGSLCDDGPYKDSCKVARLSPGAQSISAIDVGRVSTQRIARLHTGMRLSHVHTLHVPTMRSLDHGCASHLRQAHHLVVTSLLGSFGYSHRDPLCQCTIPSLVSPHPHSVRRYPARSRISGARRGMPRYGRRLRRTRQLRSAISRQNLSIVDT